MERGAAGSPVAVAAAQSLDRDEHQVVETRRPGPGCDGEHERRIADTTLPVERAVDRIQVHAEGGIRPLQGLLTLDHEVAEVIAERAPRDVRRPYVDRVRRLEIGRIAQRLAGAAP